LFDIRIGPVQILKVTGPARPAGLFFGWTVRSLFVAPGLGVSGALCYPDASVWTLSMVN